MVQLSDHLGRAPDLTSQINGLKGYDQDDISDLDRTAALVAPTAYTSQSEAMLSILADLQMDAATLISGLALFSLQGNELELSQVSNADAEKLLSALVRLAHADRAVISAEPMFNRKTTEQVANARHLLINLIDDPRVAVVKLAEQVVVLDRLGGMEDEGTLKIVRDAIDFFSPLAERIGIFKLKWLLEDLAFRCLRRWEYEEIASRLGATRHDRELQVEAVCEELKWRLEQAQIGATVRGRAKHIYGIWRKMREKTLEINQVRDTEAVRVIVDSVEACYASLGVVHTSWPHIPDEFDDYIANPKENGYQSIHTAVVGPRGRTLEVQIRTRKMHESAELGICSHWAYKGIDDTSMQGRKVEWLRHVIEWHDELRREGPDTDLFMSDEPSERVYVTTPQGHVVDLAQGATAVDFAYRIHTDIGHNCIAAIAEGKQIDLNQPLSNGMVVTIQTDKAATPKREWLNPELGYVRTARARDKVQAWFKNQEAEANIEAGRQLLRDTLQRVGLRVETRDLLDLTEWKTETALLHAIGVGDQLVNELVHLLVRQPSRSGQYSVILAGRETSEFKAFSIQIQAVDRPRLLVETATVIADGNVNLVSTVARVVEAHKLATITAQIQVENLAELSILINRLRRISGVQDVRRIDV